MTPSDGGSGPPSDDGSVTPSNDGSVFDRLPATAGDRRVPGRPAREEVLSWWERRFGVPPDTFEGHTFWEKGAGKVWAFAADAPSPVGVEGLGLKLLRTRREHWKPTTNAVGRFGDAATRNVVDLGPAAARCFLAGEDQAPDWDGDWGYLIVRTELGGDPAVLGVGLFVHGELRSQVPKGRRVDLPAP